MDQLTSDTDRRILASLQLDGRASWQVLARSVGVSASTVQRRYAMLRKSGRARVIGVVDVLRCGLGVPVLVRVSTQPGKAGAVAALLAASPRVRFVALLTGGVDVVAEVILPSYGDYAGIQNGLAAMEGITNTETLAVIRTFTSAHDWDTHLLEPNSTALLGARHGLPFEDPTWAQPPIRLNELELGIVAALAEDGRATIRDVASQLSSSESMVGRRIESMVNAGCLRFRTLVEPTLLGFSVELMIWLEVQPSELEAAGRKLASHPNVKYLSATTGPFNLCAQVSLLDYSDVYPFTTDVVGSLQGLRRADTALQYETLKRAWFPTDRELLVSAEAVHNNEPSATAVVVGI